MSILNSIKDSKLIPNNNNNINENMQLDNLYPNGGIG